MVGTDSLVAVRGGQLTSWGDFVAVWLEPLNAGTSFVDTQAVFYRPLATLLFAAEYTIWGFNPVGFHLTNTVIQAAVVAVGFGALRAFGISLAGAVFGAALIGFHPSMAAAVPVIARRYDALSVAALFACLLLFARALDARETRWSLASVLSALALGVALLCKESAFGFVPLLPLVLVARRGRTSLKEAAQQLAPHAIVAAVVFGARYAVLGTLGGHSGTTPVAGFDLGGYELMLGRYAQFLTWPYDQMLPTTFRGALGLAVVAAVIAVLGLISLPGPQRRLFALGLAWVIWFGVFFAALLHLSGPWYMYYPLGGAVLICGACIDGLRARLRARELRSIPVALALAGPLTYSIAALPASPLIRDYAPWHVAGDLTRGVLQGSAACIQELRSGEAITFWNLPRDYLDGTREVEFLAVTMLETFSMEAYLEIVRPSEPHAVFVGSSVRITGAVPDVRTQCERPGADRLRLVVTGQGLPTPDLPPFDAGFG